MSHYLEDCADEPGEGPSAEQEAAKNGTLPRDYWTSTELERYTDYCEAQAEHHALMEEHDA